MKSSVLRASVQFNVRLPRAVQSRVKVLAGRRGMAASSMAARYIEEGVRMDLFPGIDFRWTPSGRFPHVQGTGLDVWQLFKIWEDHGGDLRKIRRNYPHLTAAQVAPAVGYAQAFRGERPVEVVPPASFREVKV